MLESYHPFCRGYVRPYFKNNGFDSSVLNPVWGEKRSLYIYIYPPRKLHPSESGNFSTALVTDWNLQQINACDIQGIQAAVISIGRRIPRISPRLPMQKSLNKEGFSETMRAILCSRMFCILVSTLKSNPCKIS